MKNYDVLVVGAGLWGCSVARLLAEQGKIVLLKEERECIGGNVSCQDKNGFEIHTYGTHVFHTDSTVVWNFLTRFTTLNSYRHKVISKLNGQSYFLPISMPLISKFFNVELTPAQVSKFLQSENRIQKLYEAFFYGYTAKQWGEKFEDIEPSVIKRIPWRSDYNVDYFQDTMQGIPISGYNAMFQKMIDHPNIILECNSKVDIYEIQQASIGNKHIFYSGALDQLFEYEFGPLPWRTAKFELELLKCCDYQGIAVVNFPDSDIPYTRMHEFKHLHPERKAVMGAPYSYIMKEYPEAWSLGKNKLYPIENIRSLQLFQKYQTRAVTIKNFTAGGRLGSYRYMNMDQTIAEAIKACDSVKL